MEFHRGEMGRCDTQNILMGDVCVKDPQQCIAGGIEQSQVQKDIRIAGYLVGTKGTSTVAL
jgi:hypothetical protein